MGKRHRRKRRKLKATEIVNRKGTPMAKAKDVMYFGQDRADSKAGASTYSKPDCHKNPALVFEHNGHRMYAGKESVLEDIRAWDLYIQAVGYSFTSSPPNATVRGIGVEHILPKHVYDVKPAPTLKINWPDQGVPQLDADWWKELVKHAFDPSKEPRNIAMSCTGGHGRTGTCLAIIATLLGLVPADEDPVEWVRGVYCDEVVESNKQLDYIELITGRRVEAVAANLRPTKAAATTPTYSHSSSTPTSTGTGASSQTANASAPPKAALPDTSSIPGWTEWLVANPGKTWAHYRQFFRNEYEKASLKVRETHYLDNINWVRVEIPGGGYMFRSRASVEAENKAKGIVTNSQEGSQSNGHAAIDKAFGFPLDGSVSGEKHSAHGPLASMASDTGGQGQAELEAFLHRATASPEPARPSVLVRDYDDDGTVTSYKRITEDDLSDEDEMAILANAEYAG